MTYSNTSTDDLSDFQIGTESEYSVNDIQNGGRFMSLFTGTDDTSTLITEFIQSAFTDGNVQCACYLIKQALKKGLKLDFSVKDDKNRSVLHNLLQYCGYNKYFKELFLEILKTHDLSMYINDKDNNGDTLAHIAVRLNQDDILTELIRLGIDLTIVNNQDMQISLKKIKPKNNDSVFIKIENTQCSDKSEEDSDLRTELANIIKTYYKPSSSEMETIGFRPDEIVNTVSMSNAIVDTSDTKDEEDSTATNDVLRAVLSEYGRPNMNSFMFKDLVGGAKKTNLKQSTSGRRKINTYSEVSVGGFTSSDMNDDDDESSSANMHELARELKSKSTMIHDRTVKKIMEILNVDEADARVYKAALYSMVQKQNPELSNYDRATEMEKLATPEVLKSIDFDKVKAEMKERSEAKQSSSSPTSETSPVKSKKTKKDKSENSETSPVKKRKSSKKSESTLTTESGLSSISISEAEFN